MKIPTLKTYLKGRKVILVLIPLIVAVLTWVEWIVGLSMLGMAILFIYSNWCCTRACCACNLEVPYGSRYCLGCGTKLEGY